MKTINTDRIILEPQVAGHAEEMFRVLSDPTIYEHENEPPTSLDWLRQRFFKLESRRSTDGTEQWLNWVIRLSPTQLIGYVQATVFSDSTAAIAYVLSSAFWGQGFASEAVHAMMTELISQYRVHSFSAVLKQSNLRSLRLLNRMGFSQASPEEHLKAKVEIDEVMMLRNA
jgi:ribosomal-protein-alanine N-acetyltransferase